MAVSSDVELTGKVSVVTGAGHGIGEGIARKLAERGANVVINDIDEGRAMSVADSIRLAGSEAVATFGDVSLVEDVARLMHFARESFGEPDILVNNAAVFCNKPFLEHSVEEWDKIFSVNLRSVFLCTREVLPSMISGRQGSIVNIASISAFNTTTAHVAYAASKAAIVTMTRDVASEVASFNVRVNAVAPGPIDSRGIHSEPFAGIILPRPGVPGDIANAVAFLVSDAASFVTGETLSVAGGSDLKVDR